MPPNRKSLHSLLSDLENELLRIGYTHGSMVFYRHQWRLLEEYAFDKGVTVFSEQLGMDFAQDIMNISLDSVPLSQDAVQKLRVIRMIGDYQIHRTILRRYYKHREILTIPDYIEYRRQFSVYCQSKAYSAVTTEHYVKQAGYLMEYMESQGLHSIACLSVPVIDAYLNTLAGYTYKTVEQRICGIRSFMRFLNDSGAFPNTLAEQTPMIQARKQTRIPSVWTQDELRRLLNAVDRGSPLGKRDYAILLLACVLGVRASDIKTLTFSCFDWERGKISFTQSKTGIPLVLPLPKEVGWAVIDYLKNARPKVHSDVVFVRHMAPFLPFAEGDHLYQIVRKYMSLAHLPSLKKRRGMHSLRHTAASRLLESGVNLDTISNILGHEDPDSTSVYLKTDVERSRECCVPIPGGAS